MLNYSNLNDIEFEYLCKDVMSRMLDVKLQRFAAGRDGGIDLTDDSYGKNVIVQVKHYVKTDVAGLLTSLKKEIPKVQGNSPKKYYVCCSKELTPSNKSEIYEMFSDYMESTENVISLIEISDFLEEEKNGDILRKHFKLWIDSTNILTNVFTNDICIDSDVLLSDITELVHLFVKTVAYEQAISCLEKNNVLIIVGNPGVGKTITSKMLVLFYATQGYRIRYTTDGTDLTSLKRALSQSPDNKEVILLDDCFGQAYFSMKENQENQLLALIKYVKMNSNKLLIMNSRVTIYHEANERTPGLVNSLDKKEYKAFVLDMSNVSVIEKAKIFYNHLFFCEVPLPYRENIKNNKNYKRIVKHVNYNPRIIEFVTSKRQWELVNPDEYTNYILCCLKNPEQIWKNEYERRLVNVDRILLTTLYSLTNTVISLELVKNCYEYRIRSIHGIDLSVNHFEQSLKRLQDSMIKIVDVKGRKMLSVTNPSVNDFLSAYLERNKTEKAEIISSSICVQQFKKLLNDEDYEKELHRIFMDGSVINYVFESEKQKTGFISYYCMEKKILDERYKKYIKMFAVKPWNIDVFSDRKLPRKWLFRKLFDDEIYMFYELSSIILDAENLKKIMSKLFLDEAIEFIKRSEHLFKDELRVSYKEIIEEVVQNLIEDYCDNVSADEYDVNISDIVGNHMYENKRGCYINSDAAIDEVDSIVEGKVLEEVYDYVSELPKDVIIDKRFLDKLSVTVSDTSTLVESYLQDDYADYLYEAYREKEFDDPEIEYIFER